MTYTDSSGKTYDQALKKQVNVDHVNGGEETNPAWTSEISNEDFKQALKASLKSQGLFSDNGKYLLSAHLVKVDQPMFGLDFTVTTHIEYQLTNKETNEVVFKELVVTPYTATMGDAFMGIERLRLANEGSGKKNIKNLLSELTKIDLKDIALN